MPKQNPLERWMPPGEWYAELVSRAKKHDPRVIYGAASAGEIARLEKLVDQLENAAAEKAAKAAEKAANEPAAIARAKLSALWHRANEARIAVRRMQEDMKGYRWRPEWKVLGLPSEFFDEPEGVGRDVPGFATLEDADEIAADLGAKVAALEGLKSEMKDLVEAWESGPDKFALKMFEALHRRLQAVEGLAAAISKAEAANARQRAALDAEEQELIGRDEAPSRRESDVDSRELALSAREAALGSAA